jgi:hypothetical protein
LKLAVTKAHRDHLDPAFDLDVDRKTADRTFCARRPDGA